MPNYEFIGVSATRLYYSLDLLRKLPEFKRMEQLLDARYEAYARLTITLQADQTLVVTGEFLPD